MKLPATTDWPALSALYDELAPLPPSDLATRLAALRESGHPLAEALASMLDAAHEVETQDFLESMPRLGARGAEAPEGWEPGQQVGPYRLEALLGSGGMAEVWRARRARQDDGSLRRELALKLPHRIAQPGPARAAFARRFERERDILAALRHPHIASLLDAGLTVDGQAWLALEYVQGESLVGWCDARALGLRERVALFRQVLLAVQHAHAHLVIHRDLKPGNILVTPDGQVRLLDFGIAKLLTADATLTDATELTQQAGRMLTPSYASPEQLLGQPLGTASDVYALGVILYELLSGLRPYELKRAAPAELERAILEQDPRPPSRREPEPAMLEARGVSLKAWRRVLAPELDAVVLRALSKAPSGRYSSVDALLADVDRWLDGEPVLARRPSAALRVRKFIARHRVGVGLGAGAVLGMLVLTVIALVMGLRAQEESVRARATRDFLVDIFRRADPSQSQGRDPTPVELLKYGRDRALATLGQQPELQAEVLRSIGEVQSYQDDYGAAEQTLAQASARYQQLGRSAEFAWTEVDRANVALRRGEVERAGRLLESAQAALPRPASPELLAWWYEVRADHASIRGDAGSARRHLAAALEQARIAFGPHHGRNIDLLRALAMVEMRDLRFDLAMQHLDEAAAVASALPALDPVDEFGLASERSLALRNLGRWLDALQLLTEAGPRCERALGAAHETCALILRLRTTLHLRLGDLGAAQVMVPAVLQQRQRDGSPAREAEALIVACRILAQTGQGAATEWDEPWQALEAVAAATPGEDAAPEAIASAALVRAESWLRLGRPADAARWLDAADAALVRTPALGASYAVPALVLRGHALALTGRWSDALTLQQQAATRAAAAFGPANPQTALVRLNQIAPLRNTGRTELADAVWREAQPVLDRALTDQSPLWRRLGRSPPGADAELYLF